MISILCEYLCHHASNVHEYTLWAYTVLCIVSTLQSPPKESIHFCRAEYSRLRGARWKVGGAPNPPLSWSKVGQASFWNSLDFVIFLKRDCLRLFVLVSPSFRISKRGLVQFGQTQWWVWRTPYFSPSPLDFEYVALPQVYTFFRWRLYDIHVILLKYLT